MLKSRLFLFLFILPVIASAGRVSQWSETFTLNDPDYNAIQDKSRATPSVFKLSAQPNPFNPSTVMLVSPVSGKQGSLRIYDTNGRIVADLTAELHSISSSIAWKADGFPSGIYLARLRSGKRTENLKLMLVR